MIIVGLFLSPPLTSFASYELCASKDDETELEDTFSVTFAENIKISQDQQERESPGDVQGLKWGRVARVSDPAPFDLPGL